MNTAEIEMAWHSFLFSQEWFEICLQINCAGFKTSLRLSSNILSDECHFAATDQRAEKQIRQKLNV